MDRNGTVMSSRRGLLGVNGGSRGEDVCHAFFEPTAAAIRQWRYERPAQGPLQFKVHVRYRSGFGAHVITQAGSDLQAIRARHSGQPGRTRYSRRRNRDGRPEYFNQALRSVDLKQRLAELTNSFRELERAQRLALERASATPELAEASAGAGPAERRLGALSNNRFGTRARSWAMSWQPMRTSCASPWNASVVPKASFGRHRRQLEASNRQPEQTTTAAVSPEPASSPDASRQLVSPSGRPPMRVTPPVTAPDADQGGSSLSTLRKPCGRALRAL